MKFHCPNPEAVVRQAFWLAWNACGGPVGMGVFQDRPGATPDEVWAAVRRPAQPGRAYGDYVFGRMMKLRLSWDPTAVEYDESPPSPDYQAWCATYPTYQALLYAAANAVEPAPAG